MATEIALAAYRAHAGAGDALVELLREDVATLRANGHVTGRPAPLVRTVDGDVLVVIEWSSERAVDDAHADPEVLAVWQRKAELADYVAPASLAGAEAPFGRWTLIADL